MRPVLFSLSTSSVAACLAVFALIVMVAGIWLGVLRLRKVYTKDHLITVLSLCGMAAILLIVVNRLGYFHVNAYGAMLMTGFIVGMLSAIRLGRRRGVAAESLLDLGLLILVSAIVGARVLYWAITPNPGPLFDPHDVATNGLGGLSFHGGLLGGLLATLIYVRVKKIHFWRLADTLAPGLAVGYAITRIGCFLNGCCYGKACDLPWAVVFPKLHDHIPRHPSQLYASLMGFAMFGILLLLSRGKSLGRAGRLLMAFLMLEGVERFTMEIFREPDPTGFSVLTGAQIFSIILALCGLMGWFALPKQDPVLAQPLPESQKTGTVSQVK